MELRQLPLELKTPIYWTPKEETAFQENQQFLKVRLPHMHVCAIQCIYDK